MSEVPAAQALVVVDVQRGLVEGARRVPDAERVLAAVRSAVASARAAGVLVVHLQDDGYDGDTITFGTPGWELAVPAGEDEPVLRKDAEDGFVGTGLGDRLDAAGVRTVALVGIQSEMCVAATARGALAHGLTVVLPHDGHATYDVPADGPMPAVPALMAARAAEWSLGAEIVLPDTVADLRWGPG